MLATIDSTYRMHLNKVNKFKNKIHIEKEIGNFIYKTVETPQELREALELRYQVFYREMIGKKRKFGIDVDRFDRFSDHLVIVDKTNLKIVGTYRLNSSLFAEDFYSAREFNLVRILSYGMTKLELGRACIHKDYRRGAVIALLWRGIVEYMNAIQAELVFGCATIKTADPQKAALLHRYFEEENRIKADYLAWPTSDFKMPHFDIWKARYQIGLTSEERKQAEELIPSLCKSYIKMGALIGGEPALDREFNCIDFLTVLRRSEINQAILRRCGG